MNVDNLVTMANQIGSFYETMPDRPKALFDISDHIVKFWEPRMRRALLTYIDANQNTALTPIVMESLQANRTML